MLYRNTGALLIPLTGIYAVVGVHPVAGQLYVAVLGAATAALTTVLAREVLPNRWALSAGLIVALLPSQIVWSSVILKDASVWLAFTALAVTVAVAGRSSGLRLLVLGAVAAGLVALLAYARLYAMVIAAWALMLSAPFGSRHLRILRILGAVVIGVTIPWLAFNMGPAGITYARHATPSYTRAAMAENARSALVAPPPAATGSPQTGDGRAAAPPPAATGSPQTGGGGRAGHPGSAATGQTSKQGEVAADLKHLPSGLLAMLVQPYPWQASGSLYLKLAGVQAVVWYPLLLVSLFGLIWLRPRHFRVMAFPLLAGGAILVSFALTEGNLGTAFRQRGEFEWVVAVLDGFGLWRMARWRQHARNSV
jgi:4-amino-4-deoxy-L-arabinose transferase-like glycosyltransferase